MREAKGAGLTKQTYIWIVTQPVIGSDLDLAPQEFTEGMLGVHFDTSSKAMVHEIDTAVTVFGHALNTLHLDKSVTGWAKQAMVQRFSLISNLFLCESMFSAMSVATTMGQSSGREDLDSTRLEMVQKI